MAITGHCLCGAVSYTSPAAPITTVLCHCDDCQRSSGSAFSTNLLVPKEGLDVTGEVSAFQTTGTETGRPRERQFCGQCGSQLFTRLEELPDLVVIKAGTVDDRSVAQPQAEIWTESAQEWRAAGDGKRPMMPRGLPQP